MAWLVREPGFYPEFVSIGHVQPARAVISSWASFEEEVIMPQSAWSNKRERQYEHIKSGVLKRGASTGRAEEIAARTVNKERAQHGESHSASASSLHDMPASRRGGLRSHKGSGGRTFKQLYAEAAARNIKGRSGMNKAQLEKALA